MQEAKLREEICAVGRSMFERGLTHGSTGNISARCADFSRTISAYARMFAADAVPRYSSIRYAPLGSAGSIAISLLMLPIVARSAEVVLLLVPDGLREAALALGAPRWRVVARVVLPTALPGLVTGSLLAVARGAGETAPLLFTVQATLGTSFNLSERMNSLPLEIFNDIQSPNPEVVQRAWGAALTLVALVLALTLVARFIARRSQFAT